MAMQSFPSAGAPLAVSVHLLPTAGLDAAAVAPWCAVLDAEERTRAGRFASARGRVGFVAAHALARAELARRLGVAPAALGFAAGPYGKPVALLNGGPVPLSFSLSHAEGMVGLAIASGAGLAIGFDLEPLVRRVSPEVARRFFTAREIAALRAAAPAQQAEMLLRLWTLKEAFVKATGRGLGEGLDSFGFTGRPPRLFFVRPREEAAEAWVFLQRRLAGFAVALGVRAEAVAAAWHRTGPVALARRLRRAGEG